MVFNLRFQPGVRGLWLLSCMHVNIASIMSLAAFKICESHSVYYWSAFQTMKTNIALRVNLMTVYPTVAYLADPVFEELLLAYWLLRIDFWAIRYVRLLLRSMH